MTFQTHSAAWDTAKYFITEKMTSKYTMPSGSDCHYVLIATPHFAFSVFTDYSPP